MLNVFVFIRKYFVFTGSRIPFNFAMLNLVFRRKREVPERETGQDGRIAHTGIPSPEGTSSTLTYPSNSIGRDVEQADSSVVSESNEANEILMRVENDDCGSL